MDNNGLYEKAWNKIVELYQFGEKVAYKRRLNLKDYNQYETIVNEVIRLVLKVISKTLRRNVNEREHLNYKEIELIISLIEFHDSRFIKNDIYNLYLEDFFLKLIIPSLLIGEVENTKLKVIYIEDNNLYFDEKIDLLDTDNEEENYVDYIGIDDIDILKIIYICNEYCLEF
ncbi:MAG: hypothetical protein IAC58_00825 [Firmicutes bacterium]|uniref:Uncharacterized protein n=1 Tax=Candidatus Onthovivens merdipullorum TaxID=2840889 RepID=A0A9D9DH81_9BACL|nr:hypothetical protein [Candidatus Onthovivens merdipullorum]